MKTRLMLWIILAVLALGAVASVKALTGAALAAQEHRRTIEGMEE